MSEKFPELEEVLGTGVARDSGVAGAAGELYLTVAEPEFPDITWRLNSAHFNLIGLFCVERFGGWTGFALLYVFERADYLRPLVLVRRLTSSRATSVAQVFATACWFEREVRDGFGVEFTGSYDARRLFLHECYAEGFHPLLKSFANRSIETNQPAAGTSQYRFKEVLGEGVYQVPVGPVHAGIIEPGHFRFSVVGETIFNLEIRMFYKHRGIEKLAEGRHGADCVAVAEAISGDESVANATGFCLALEQIGGATAPRRAWLLRTILLELERVYSHLGDMAGMVLDVAFPAGASSFYVLREDVLRLNEAITGSRFARGIICPGGLKRDFSQESLDAVSHFLRRFPGQFKEGLSLVLSTSSVVDRLERTGVIPVDLVSPLNLTGPAARASGAVVDTRVDHPYGVYGSLPLQKRTGQAGDVLSRFDVRVREIEDSVAMIERMVGTLEPGPVCVAPRVDSGFALVLVEAPRGQSMHWLQVDNGVVSRYKVRTASFCNWQAIEHAVIGNIVPDFPLINKSLNLSYAGTDL